MGALTEAAGRSGSEPERASRVRYLGVGLACGPAVEWTLRVNMFEAMLYAALKTLGEQGLWRGSVFPVAPAKVSKFWQGKGEEG